MTLEERKQILVRYLECKADEGDWHAVADAAMDLRELDIKIKLRPISGIVPGDIYPMNFAGVEQRHVKGEGDKR